jgi:hypothetical protein
VIILSIYDLILLLLSSYSASGRVSGFLSSRFVIIFLIKGDMVEGRGAGSLYLISNIVSK